MMNGQSLRAIIAVGAELLASGAILLAATGAPAQAAPPKCDINEIAYVVERMDTARQIHAAWANMPPDDPKLKVAGDIEWQKRWTADYDRTVELIKSLALKAC